MWSFQDQSTQFQDMAQSQNTEHLVIGKRNINMGQKILETELGYPPEEDYRDITTTTSDIYNLPENFIRAIGLYVTSGTTRYVAEEVYSEDAWQLFKTRTTGNTSDYLTHFFVRQSTFEISPTPVTAGNTMRLRYEALSRDLQNLDYSTGTITTLAALGTAVTASGSTFTAGMVGRYFKINDDGQWYKISAFTDTTHITLATPYQGTAISAGSSSYTIGEMPRTPAATHIIPVYFALWKHFEGVRRDPKMGAYYKTLFEQNMKWAKSTYSNRFSDGVIPSQRHLRRRAMLNPNWFPRDIT